VRPNRPIWRAFLLLNRPRGPGRVTSTAGWRWYRAVRMQMEPGPGGRRVFADSMPKLIDYRGYLGPGVGGLGRGR
jgi:hypothetical protein